VNTIIIHIIVLFMTGDLSFRRYDRSQIEGARMAEARRMARVFDAGAHRRQGPSKPEKKRG
jgi:hypothetical protein